MNIRQPAALEITIRGYQSIHFEADSDLNILRATGPDDVKLVTVGTFAAVKSGPWTIHEAFLNLVRFTGDGSYTIQPPRPDSGKQAMTSNAYTVISRSTPGNPIADAGRFDRIVKPCVAEVRNKGTQGTLNCQGLADSAGNVITLNMVWRANGTPEDLLKDAMARSTSSTSAPAAGSPAKPSP